MFYEGVPLFIKYCLFKLKLILREKNNILIYSVKHKLILPLSSLLIIPSGWKIYTKK